VRKLIERLFLENNYTVRPILNDSSLLASDTAKSNYYLSIFLTEADVQDLVVGSLNEHFDAIKGLDEGYEPQMDKNLSMLICVKRSSLNNNSTLNKQIFDIEEDPYFFKKYVLTYTESQEELILRNVKDTSVMTYLHTILNSEDAFQTHKKFPYHETEYNLVSKLFIKLPILNLTIRNEELPSLKVTVNNLLTPDLLQFRDDLLNLNKIEDADGETEEVPDEDTLRKRLLEYVGVKLND